MHLSRCPLFTSVHLGHFQVLADEEEEEEEEEEDEDEDEDEDDYP